MKKPEWKVEFDKQVAQCGIDIADLFRNYPEPVVLAALNKELSECNSEQYREDFEDMYNADDI